MSSEELLKSQVLFLSWSQICWRTGLAQLTCYSRYWRIFSICFIFLFYFLYFQVNTIQVYRNAWQIWWNLKIWRMIVIYLFLYIPLNRKKCFFSWVKFITSAKIVALWDMLFFVIFISFLLLAFISPGKKSAYIFFLLPTIICRNCNLSIKHSLKWMLGIDKFYPCFFWCLTSFA